MSAPTHRKQGRAGAARPVPGTVRARAAADARLAFLRGFLERPFEVASIIPSSRFLEQRIVKLAGVRTATSVVELGPGTGGTTRAILRAMPPEARLLGVEINPDFHALLGRIEDPRFLLHLGSAADLVETLAARGLPAPQAIISGIPFSTMGHATASAVANAIAAALAPGGRFVAYQFTDQVHRFCRPHLGKARVELELLNIPPVRVYQWQKESAPQPVGRRRNA